MDFLLIYFIFNGVRYWPAICIAAVMLMALVDLALVGCTAVYAFVRVSEVMVPIKNSASVVESP